MKSVTPEKKCFNILIYLNDKQILINYLYSMHPYQRVRLGVYTNLWNSIRTAETRASKFYIPVEFTITQNSMKATDFVIIFCFAVIAEL